MAFSEPTTALAARDLYVMPLMHICSNFRMILAVNCVRGEQFVKGTLIGPMAAFSGFIAAYKLV